MLVRQPTNSFTIIAPGSTVIKNAKKLFCALSVELNGAGESNRTFVKLLLR